MVYRQRDIVLIPFPFTDLSHTKLRPALIISGESVNATGDFVCAQITSKVFPEPTFFPLENSMLEKSLPLVSGIRLHKVVCLNQVLVAHNISTMHEQAFRIVMDKLIQTVFKSELTI